MRILAIETSCDETAAAVVEVDRSPRIVHRAVNRERLSVNILSSVIASQIDLHKKYGGVFPEIASRAHTEKIIPVVEEALRCEQKNIKTEGRKNSSYFFPFLRGVNAIAVTTGPGLIGSLLIGVNFAKTMALAKNLPIIPVNHLLGHIYSNFVGENSKFKIQNSKLPNFPSLILIVSGGHTGLYLMKSHNEIKLLGETLDDAAGEAFDKVAKILNLGYPGGPAIAAEAAKFKIKNSKLKIEFPRSMLDRKDYNFSFSGLKTAVLYKVKELSHISHLSSQITSTIAASFQQAAIDILIGKTIQAAYEFKPKSICLCGGVSANKELREQLKKAVSGLPWHPSFHKPHFQLSTDNAAMIGIAVAYHLNDKTTWDKISTNANLRLL